MRARSQSAVLTFLPPLQLARPACHASGRAFSIPEVI